jgi:hypothetical protein
VLVVVLDSDGFFGTPGTMSSSWVAPLRHLHLLGQVEVEYPVGCSLCPSVDYLISDNGERCSLVNKVGFLSPLSLFYYYFIFYFNFYCWLILF